MAEAYAGICLMCGRTLGYAVDGRFVTSPGGATPRLQRGRLQCGHCGGGVLFEPDAALPPDWVAQMRREEVAGAAPRRVYRRHAV